MTKLTSQGKQPLVSIITPLHNGERFIAETIKSIRSQSYQNWEHLIVDDYSKDTSASIVKEFADKDARIKFSSLSRNGGAAHARNIATSAAKGEYIAFLDADDLWHPDKLSNHIAFMQKNNCVVSYTSYVHINHKSKEIGKRIIALPKLTYHKQHHNNYVGNLTGIYNVAKIGKITAPNIKKRQDWAVWLEAIKKSGKPALGLQEDLAYYRVHSSSMSSNKVNLVKYNYHFYRTYLRYPAPKATLYLLRFFWEFFVTRKKWIERY